MSDRISIPWFTDVFNGRLFTPVIGYRPSGVKMTWGNGAAVGSPHRTHVVLHHLVHIVLRRDRNTAGPHDLGLGQRGEDTAVVAGAADLTAATEERAAPPGPPGCLRGGRLAGAGGWARAGAEWEARPVAGPADAEPVGEEESAEATAAPV